VTLTRAIVKPPGPRFADGLTTSGLGPPDLARALEQHARYCDALEACGLRLIRLADDPAYPDGTFVEDTAVVFGDGALVARPGAPSRRGEVDAVRVALSGETARPDGIASPGTLDGGDVCDAEQIVLIGVSARTNEVGASQLARWLEDRGRASRVIDIRGTPGLLHLKSGLAWLGGRRLAAVSALAGHEALRDREVVVVPAGEEYAANCVRINGRLLTASGYPAWEAALRALREDVVVLDVSEFRKMDGGLSCLSIRF